MNIIKKIREGTDYLREKSGKLGKTAFVTGAIYLGTMAAGLDNTEAKELDIGVGIATQSIEMHDNLSGRRYYEANEGEDFDRDDIGKSISLKYSSELSETENGKLDIYGKITHSRTSGSEEKTVEDSTFYNKQGLTMNADQEYKLNETRPSLGVKYTLDTGSILDNVSVYGGLVAGFMNLEEDISYDFDEIYNEVTSETNISGVGGGLEAGVEGKVNISDSFDLKLDFSASSAEYDAEGNNREKTKYLEDGEQKVINIYDNFISMDDLQIGSAEARITGSFEF